MNDTENNFPPDFLSEAHLAYIEDYLQFEQQKDEAVLDQFFLKEKS